MTRYGGAANLLPQFSANFHHRLFSFLWVRRNVKCFSHNTGSSGLPVRYISKRQRELNKTQYATPVEISPKDGIPSNSDSRDFGHKNFDPMKGLRVTSNKGKLLNVEDKLSNALLDSKYELKHSNKFGKEVTVKEVKRVNEQVVDCRKAAEIVVKESPIYRRGGLSQDLNLSQELSNDGLVVDEYMEAPKCVFEESHEAVVKESLIYRRGGPCQDLNLNQEFSNDEIVDEEYMELMEAPEEVLEESPLINGNVSKSDRSKQGAEKLAVELLGKRAFTVVGLRKKLTAKQFPLSIIEAVLRDFQKRGLINDGMYAETFSHSRWNSSSWGPRRIKQALTQKGVSENNVTKAVKLVFEDPEESDQNSSIKLSSSSLQQLYIQASKQWQRSQNVPHETRKARVIRWLQYRGFDWGVVGTIMKKLESEYPR